MPYFEVTMLGAKGHSHFLTRKTSHLSENPLGQFDQ